MSPAKPTYQPNQIKYLSFSVRTKLGLFAAVLFLLSPKEVDMRLIGNIKTFFLIIHFHLRVGIFENESESFDFFVLKMVEC